MKELAAMFGINRNRQAFKCMGTPRRLTWERRQFSPAHPIMQSLICEMTAMWTDDSNACKTDVPSRVNAARIPET